MLTDYMPLSDDQIYMLTQTCNDHFACRMHNVASPDARGDHRDREQYWEQPGHEDDDIDKMIRICSPLFSYSTGIEVRQVSQEMTVDSGYCLKDQLKRGTRNKVLQVQELMKIMVLLHIEELVQLQVEHQEIVQG